MNGRKEVGGKWWKRVQGIKGILLLFFSLQDPCKFLSIGEMLIERCQLKDLLKADSGVQLCNLCQVISSVFS